MRHTPAQPQAPQRATRSAPGAQRRTQAEAHPRAKAAQQATLPLAERAAHAQTAWPPREGSERDTHSLRQRGPQGGVAAGFRTPAFHTAPRGAEERRGARRQDEKIGPIRHECPSLAWCGFGPAQESAKSPHRSVSGRNAGSGGKPSEGRFHQGARFGLAGPVPHGGRQTTQNGERLTRGTEPWKRASSQKPPSVPAAGSARQ